jgi:hypothetical protein
MDALQVPFSALISYHFFGDDRGKELVRNLGLAGGRVIGDSGAYSALTQGLTIPLDSYADWLDEMQPFLAWAASLDVIGDAEASWRNWRRLTTMGFWTVPTVHYTAPTSVLDRYAEAGATLVGFGGLVSANNPTGGMRWLVHMFRHIRDNYPHLRIHGWGISGRAPVMNLPFYSVDSSGFGAAYRYGRMALFDPAIGWMRSMDLDGYSTGAHGRWLREHYGVEPRDIATSHGGNRDVVRYLMFESAQRMERYFEQRHQVTPPPELTHQGNGTHVHFADASDNVIRHLADCLKAGRFIPDLPGVRRA